jgi:quinol monooxygenase YgiN
MITLVIRIKVQDGKQAEFEKAASEQVERVRANEPGTVLYTMVRSQTDATEYYFLEAYKDDEAFAFHIQEFQKIWGPQMNSMIAQPNVVTRCDDVAGFAREVIWKG